MWLPILIVSVISLLVNIPMGMMRERYPKFSWQWIAWIHASIPLIIFLRIALHLPVIAIPINIAAAVIGQLIGAAPAKKKRKATLPSAT